MYGPGLIGDDNMTDNGDEGERVHHGSSRYPENYHFPPNIHLPRHSAVSSIAYL